MTNYEKGRKKEYQIIHDERACGRIAFRSAGSHSPIDVVSIDVNSREIRFIQSKAGAFSNKARQRLLDENNLLNGSFFCKFEVR